MEYMSTKHVFEERGMFHSLCSFSDVEYVTSASLVDFSCRVSWSVTNLYLPISTACLKYGPICPHSDVLYLPTNVPQMYRPKLFSPVVIQPPISITNPGSHSAGFQHIDLLYLKQITNKYSALIKTDYSLMQHVRNSNSFKYDYISSSDFFTGPGGNRLQRNKYFNPSSSAQKYNVSRKNLRDTKQTRRHKCPYCNVVCTNNGQLKGHIRVHTGEKPFTCDSEECGKSFARNEELTRHQMIHTGLRLHSCDVCEKKFGRKDHLNKHRKTHLKNSAVKKTHACHEMGCGQSYTRSDALARHQWSCHGIKTRISNLHVV